MPSEPIDLTLGRGTEAGAGVAGEQEETVQLVVFRLGDGLWAVRGRQVREILRDLEVYFVPGCPSVIEGVINVRGEIAAVLGLGAVLGVLAEGETETADTGARTDGWILLCTGGDQVTGLRVSAVEDVVEVAASEILAPSASLGEALRPVVDGVLSYRGGLATLIDLDRVLPRYRATLGQDGGGRG